MSREAWTAAFVKMQAALPQIGKGKTATIATSGGGSYSYSYADLPTIIEAVRPILVDHGFAVAQSVGGEHGVVTVTTILFHEAGHSEEFGPTTVPASGDARSVGSAITYARRYGLCAALGIVPDEDDDGAAASVSVTDYIRSKVAAFDKWSIEERREQWKSATGGKQPKTTGQVDKVIEKMAEAYYEAHPDTRPF